MITRVTYFCDCNDEEWSTIFIDTAPPRMQCDKCWMELKTHVEELPEDWNYKLDKKP